MLLSSFDSVKCGNRFVVVMLMCVVVVCSCVLVVVILGWWCSRLFGVLGLMLVVSVGSSIGVLVDVVVFGRLNWLISVFGVCLVSIVS